jgi:hypothetical protein
VNSVSSQPRNRALRLLLLGWLGCLVAYATACAASAGSSQDGRAAAPTPVTRAARTAAAIGSPTALPRLPTAVIFADPATGRPVWPTPPPSCSVSAVGSERPDLGPTIGESPLWLASQVLPVVPWRNDFIRSVWVVERSTEGDLILSGHRTDAPGVAQFLRPGGERATEQLRISSAGRVGSPDASPRYADNQVYIALPSTGCWELSARLGTDLQRTFTFYVYN